MACPMCMKPDGSGGRRKEAFPFTAPANGGRVWASGSLRRETRESGNFDSSASSCIEEPMELTSATTSPTNLARALGSFRRVGNSPRTLLMTAPTSALPLWSEAFTKAYLSTAPRTSGGRSVPESTIDVLPRNAKKNREVPMHLCPPSR